MAGCAFLCLVDLKNKRKERIERGYIRAEWVDKEEFRISINRNEERNRIMYQILLCWCFGYSRSIQGRQTGRQWTLSILEAELRMLYRNIQQRKMHSLFELSIRRPKSTIKSSIFIIIIISIIYPDLLLNLQTPVSPSKRYTKADGFSRFNIVDTIQEDDEVSLPPSSRLIWIQMMLYLIEYTLYWTSHEFIISFPPWMRNCTNDDLGHDVDPSYGYCYCSIRLMSSILLSLTWRGNADSIQELMLSWLVQFS